MCTVAKVRREIAGRQALIQQLETKRSDILQAAAMDQACAELPPSPSMSTSSHRAAHAQCLYKQLAACTQLGLRLWRFLCSDLCTADVRSNCNLDVNLTLKHRVSPTATPI